MDASILALSIVRLPLKLDIAPLVVADIELGSVSNIGPKPSILSMKRDGFAGDAVSVDGLLATAILAYIEICTGAGYWSL